MYLLSLCLFSQLSVCLSFFLSFLLYVYLPVCLGLRFVFLSVTLSVWLSVSQSVSQSVSLSISLLPICQSPSFYLYEKFLHAIYILTLMPVYVHFLAGFWCQATSSKYTKIYFPVWRTYCNCKTLILKKIPSCNPSKLLSILLPPTHQSSKRF